MFVFGVVKEQNQLPSVLEDDIRLEKAQSVSKSFVLERANSEETISFIGDQKKDKFRSFRYFFQKIFNIKVAGTLLVAWLALCIGLFTVIFSGPGFKKLGLLGVPFGLRPCWRSQVTLILLLIPTILELKHVGVEGRRKLLQKEILLLFFGCASCWAVTLVVWLVSLDYTTISNAALFGASYPIILVIWYKIRKVPISIWEIIGTVIGFVGVVMTLAGGFGKVNTKELFGDSMDIFVAFVNAALVLMGSRLRQTAQLMTYTFFTTLFVACSTAIFSVSTEGSNFGYDGPKAVFGWVNGDFVYITLFLGLMVGAVGVLAYNFALKHVPPLGYAVFKLLEPPISGAVAVMIGLDGFPSIFTFIGGGITIVGIFVVQYGLNKRKQSQTADYKTLSEDVPQVELEELSQERMQSQGDSVEETTEVSTTEQPQEINQNKPEVVQ